MVRRAMMSWWAILALAVAFTATATAPATASATTYSCPATYPRPAFCDGPVQTQVAGPSHIGWVYLNLNYCPSGMACAAVYRATMPAWSWTGSAWRGSSVAQGWVYVYPYTGGWRWVWTQRSGWVAVNSGRFEIRNY